MNSFSHYAFGAVCQWMFQKLAGIDTDGPGYKEIIIDPHPPTPGSNPEHPPINWVKASYDSIHGRITSNWKRTKDEFILEVSVPANTTATVYLPTSNSNSIQESGRPLNKQSKDSGIEAIETQGKKLKIKIASGSYHFTAKLN